MSNHRNPRRRRQRVRAEVSRKPPKITRSMEHLVSSQPAERARKEEIRRQDRPTKSERREKELAIRRWLVLSRAPRSKWLTRKPRTNTRLARHDLDN